MKTLLLSLLLFAIAACKYHRGEQSPVSTDPAAGHLSD